MSNSFRQLQDYYDKDSERFWSAQNGFTGRDLDVYPLTLGLKGRLLEYGCGSGSLLLNLALQERFTDVWGVDISPKALTKVQDSWNRMSYNSLRSKVKLCQPDNDSLHFLDASSFDLLISVATIEHVLNPYLVLDELYRLARPGATLICSVPNYAYLKHRVQLLFGIQPRTGTDEPVRNWRVEGWDGMHLHTFTKSSFTTLLLDCGWLPQRWLGCGTRFNSIGLGFLRRRFPGLWSGEIIVACSKH
jgi:SAM-dependent methyltransferase